MTKSSVYRGIFTIPSTPFTASGEIDIPSFRRLIDFCIECGAHGLVFPVNASEFTTLSDAERFQLAEILVEQNAGRLPVVIGVAGVAQEVAVTFARHAREIGADSVIAMPPYVKRSPLSQALIFEYYDQVAKAAQIPVWIQNYVPPIGTDMSPELVLELCREIEGVQYIKEETVPSTMRLSSILKNNDGSCKGVFGGAGGRYMIEEYRRGVSGQMPGCHVTDVMVAFWNALEKGDESHAMRIYKELAPLYFFERQLSGCYKEVLYRRGVIDCPLKRLGAMPLDDIASKYLDDILINLQPFMSWSRS
jgi:dihydrodipicolinate synthase/N-acetylneuraminate lyase